MKEGGLLQWIPRAKMNRGHELVYILVPAEFLELPEELDPRPHFEKRNILFLFSDKCGLSGVYKKAKV